MKIDDAADKLKLKAAGTETANWARNLKEATVRLKLRCTEVMRAVAREFGEVLRMDPE